MNYNLFLILKMIQSCFSAPKKWSTEREETRLAWSDLDLDNAGVHLALRSVVVGVWFKATVEYEAGKKRIIIVLPYNGTF